MPRVLIVVPCYDEAKRLDVERFVALAESLSLLFVNDGSRDATPEVLEAMRARAPERIRVLSLAKNSGKGEAVRQGLLAAIEAGAEVVGFADSDLATPPDELLRLVRLMDENPCDVVMGSRVALAGSQVDRKPVRHYMGRVFATAASLVLDARFYDTQCGAKLFRVSPLLHAILREKFHSRWLFDVELLGRLLVGTHDQPGVLPERFLEVPLRRWTDVDGSKVRASALVRAGVDLGRIHLDLLARRRERAH